jgi:hypothetical protein
MADEIFERHQVDLDSELTKELAPAPQRGTDPGIGPSGTD